MMKEHNTQPKKASKRFAYPVEAFVEFNHSRHVIQIQNISKTGIQFLSNVPFPSQTHIRLMWQDTQIGAMESLVLIVRTIEQEGESKFEYRYGSKFINLKEEIRKNVNRVVEITEEHERKSHETWFDHMPFKTINEVIIHGRAYLRDALRENKSSGVIEKFVKELKDYEKQSFNESDDQSLWIQKIVTQYFHSRILLVVLLSTVRISDLRKLIMDKIQSMECLVTECQKFMESNRITKKTPLHESLNRLVYARLELIEAFNKRAASPVVPRRS
jgi:hypothetical protein